MRELTILISVILAVVVFGALNRQFLDVETVVTILENAAPDGLIVIGMCIVIICGAFDMSVGSAMAVCGLVAALVMNKAHLPVPLAMLAALATGAAVGWGNGSLVTRLGINPFITTLGTMSILRGVVQVVTRSAPLTGFPESFLKLAWGTVFTLHLPSHRLIAVRVPVVLLVVSIIVSDLLLRRLRYLRQVYFVGSNEEAARLTGIPTAQVKTFAFMRRLVEALDEGETLCYRYCVRDLKKRYMFSFDPRRHMHLDPEYHDPCQASSPLVIERVATVEDIMANWQTYCVEVMYRFLELFPGIPVSKDGLMGWVRQYTGEKQP